MFRVEAVNAVGESLWSEPSDPIIAATVPDAPSKPVLLSRTKTELRLKWTVPSDGGSQIRQQLVFWDQGINSFVPLNPVIRNPAVTTFTVTQATHGLLTGTLYSFKIQAINDVGASLFSETLEDEMPAVVPTPPLNLRLVTSTASSIFIEWFDPLSNGGTQVMDYQVFFAEENSSDFELLAPTTLGMNSYL